MPPKSRTETPTKTKTAAKAPKASQKASGSAPASSGTGAGLAVGAEAPAFSLPSSAGTDVSLASLRGSIVVLYFYPKDDTPGCTREAQAFEASRPALEALGARVFGVSRDSLASHTKFCTKYGLGFPLLTDADGAVMQAYRAWGEKVLYGKVSVGVIRSTVVIDREGRVAKHYPRVKVDGHADAVLALVEGLAKGR